MKILFENKELRKPKLSIILIDWSVRHSFHILDYLNNQTVERDKYEIIWIEYYDRKSKEIEKKLNNSLKNKSPILDKWILLEMPKNVYYHKHLMFNVGIIFSEGEIICIPDSDAMVKETFIQTIVDEFEKNENIVLHIDEIRNENKKFYPFNYPSFEEILGVGRVLRWDGKIDIEKLEDPIHLLNYGACMCARRKHLIEIGGADEHIDYLGHICGVYEMTFRLRNYGLKEVWSKEEFLYHTWHPGESGTFDHMGPHDGLNMSTTALNTLITKRIYPLKENRAIKLLREKNNRYQKEEFFKFVLPDNKEIKNWELERLKKQNSEISNLLNSFLIKFITIKKILSNFYRLEFLTKIMRILREKCNFKNLKSKKGKFFLIKLLKLILDLWGSIYFQIYFLSKKSKSQIRNCFLIFFNHIVKEETKKIYILENEFDTNIIFIHLSKKFNIKCEKLNREKLNNFLLKNGEKILVSCKNKEKWYKLFLSTGLEEKNIILI